MNDRFKFRGIHPVLNELQEIKFIDFIHNTIDFGDGDIFNIEDVKIQQSTGLKDKNGKLIYEGDVINDKSNHIRVVVWEQDSFKYPALKTSRYFHSPISNKLEERKVDLWGKLTFQDNISKRDKKHFEVIGNIYEDSHLIENSNNLC